MAFPNERGGDREFVELPAQAGLPDAIGDLAALMQNVLHTFSQPAGDARDALINNVNEQAVRLRQLADLARDREQNTRAPRPLTAIPAEAWGETANIAGVRTNNLLKFAGEKGSANNCYIWLEQICSTAAAHTLTFQAATLLLATMAQGSVASYISELRQEGKEFPAIVQALEVRYGELCSPDQARMLCNTMERGSLDLRSFVDQLKLKARIACREERDGNRRRDLMYTLIETNLRRGLPTSVRMAIEEKLVDRARMGLPQLTITELEQEALRLESKRLARRAELGEKKEPQKQKRRPIFAAAEVLSDDEVCVDSDADDNTAPDEVIDDDDEDECPYDYLVSYIADQKARHHRKGDKITVDKLVKQANKKVELRYDPKNRNRFTRPQRVAEVAQKANSGPPSRIDPRQKTILELLRLANCERGHCILCGMPGHMMYSDKCALRGKPVASKSCAKCGHGLHSADDCIRTFISNVNAVEEDPLNED